MNQAQTILEETMAISPAVANLPKNNPFSVPSGYFEQNTTTLFSIIHFKRNELVENEGKDEFSGLDKTVPFTLPKGYFVSFNNDLMNEIRKRQSAEEELNELSPTLTSLKKENPFVVPEKYFETQKLNIYSGKERFTPVFKINKILRYAAAACILGIITAPYIFFQHNEPSSKISSNKGDEKISSISIDDLDLYLIQAEEIDRGANSGFSTGDESNLLVDLDKQTINELLQSISDLEISKFIEEDGYLNEKSIN